MNIIDELQWRGLIYECTNKDELKKKLEEEAVTLYCGFDPTADCLHLGSLLPIITLKRFQMAGHNVIALVGGATGMIGDPTGKSDERVLLTADVISENVKGIEKVFKRFLKFDDKSKLVNNYDWASKINTIEFLRDYGKYFNVNYMLAKDTVKSRLENGLTYTEFSYMILQAMDFKHLYETENCSLQIGGQDQWGNITAGFELIRKSHGNSEVFALTSPLLLKSDGTKFGKSATGALWLDNTKTSSYELYQFLLNQNDDIAIKLLKYYTFLTEDEIKTIELDMETNAHLRSAQKRLAEEVITLVNGAEDYKKAITIADNLFKGNIKELAGSEIAIAMKDVPSVVVNGDINILDLLINVNAASSKREAREFVKNNAIRINGEIITDQELIITKNLAIEDKYLVVKRGKKNYYLAIYV